jgi:hypothetical protein
MIGCPGCPSGSRCRNVPVVAAYIFKVPDVKNAGLIPVFLESSNEV